MHICNNGCDCGICLWTDFTAVPVCTHVCRCGGSVIVPKAKEYIVFHSAYPDSGGDGRYKLYPQYLEYVTMAGEALALLLMLIGTVGYFVHNPYRKDRKNIKAAKSDLKELHKVGQKERKEK